MYIRFIHHFLLPVILSFTGLSSPAQDTADLYSGAKGSLICWTETRTSPRPLKIHCLRVDLTCPELEVFSMPGDDPDGNGPAESQLTLPVDLFTGSRALAAINANAFAGLPGTENDIRGWYKNRPVNIAGLVVTNGRVVSPVQKGRTAFWIDKNNHPRIGDPKPGDVVWQGVSDWQTLLILDNRLIPDSTVYTLHPRSALGFDGSGRWLLLVVVDGRQTGFSEGMSLYELAELFRSKGCTGSINLDGGGSSIMLIHGPDGQVRTVNSPSGIRQRPVPVMLGIRKTKPAD